MANSLEYDLEEPRRSFWTPRVGQPGKHKWAFTAIWLVYLIQPVVGVVQSDRSPEWKALNFSLITVFVVAYCFLSFAAYPRTGAIGTVVNRPRLAAPVVGFLAVNAVVSCLLVNKELLGMWVYVGAATGFSLPLGRAIAPRALLGAIAGLSVCCVVVHASVTDWLMLVFPAFFAGLGTIGIRRMAYLIAELREAREKVARLAANEERLRLARDLHDLTGHSLSLITLKAELAQRMIERAGFEDRGSEDRSSSGLAPALAAALKEVTEIEHVSRQTLADIREAVSGYRRPTLAVEIASACAALDAAGMKLHADPSIGTASGTYDPAIEAVLAWCLREAVTNAIRHSKATWVRVGLADVGGELVLTVRNDGVGLAGVSCLEAGGEGNGLKGLRERLNAVDGRISVGGSDGDFRFTAAVPLAA